MTILEEAQKLITGTRRKSYGKVSSSFARAAIVWAQVLGVSISPRQVALCMVALKLLRDANKAGRDNLVDLCGYSALAHRLTTKKARAVK